MKMIWVGIKSNLYKIVHSRLLWVHILLPIFSVTVFNLYFWGSSKTEVENVELYFQVIAILFPLMIAIVTTLMYEADCNAGGFQLLRMLPAKKANGHIANLFALIVFGSVAGLVAVIGFGVLYQGIGYFRTQSISFVLPMSFYVEIWGLLLSVNIVGYFIQYVLCYTFGKGVSLGVGIVGLLLVPLLYLGIGDFVWKWIPCSYGLRMLSYYFITNITVLNEPPYLIAYAVNEVETGTKMIIKITILTGVLFYIWGNTLEFARTDSE